MCPSGVTCGSGSLHFIVVDVGIVFFLNINGAKDRKTLQETQTKLKDAQAKLTIQFDVDEVSPRRFLVKQLGRLVEGVLVKNGMDVPADWKRRQAAQRRR